MESNLQRKGMRVVVCILLASLATAALAADILGARYDAASDQITVDIAYRGTNADHEFVVEWAECSSQSPPRLVGRLIDRQGNDAAREDYRTREELSLHDMPCRPAIVTLRLGRVAHTNVYVPERIELLGGVPERPYEEIGRIEARGKPGEHIAYVHQKLRNKARALGADAVIAVEERRREDRLPVRDAGEAPLLGNAYPGPVRKTEPGAFPPAGFQVQASGPYYEVRGIAVRFADEEDS